MSTESHQFLELRKYLLGLIDSAHKRRRIELKLMTDDDYFEELLIAEDDLIQDYVDGYLSKTDLTAFRQNFPINEERSWKIVFSRVLRTYINIAKFSDTF